MIGIIRRMVKDKSNTNNMHLKYGIFKETSKTRLQEVLLNIPTLRSGKNPSIAVIKLAR
jgi:hypothetical protein